MNNKASKNLDYLLAAKSNFLCLTLLGNLTEENLQTLDLCILEMKAFTANYCVVQFHDVTELHRSVIPRLILLQERMREMFGTIRICSLKPAFRDWLDQEKAVRPKEVISNMLEAWTEYSSKKYTVDNIG